MLDVVEEMTGLRVVWEIRVLEHVEGICYCQL